MSHGSSRLLPKLSLAIGSLLLTLVPFEWWARREFDLKHSSLADVDVTKIEDTANLKLGDLLRPSADPEIVYELRPSIAGTFLGKPYRTNSHGMRDDELPLEKPPGQLRIALVGDSLGFGWGVPIEESFCEVLERGLIAKNGGAPDSVEVMNFCVPGFNSWQEAQVLEKRAIAFQPDLIIVQYYYNDVFLPIFLLDRPERPLFCLYSVLSERLNAQESVTSALTLPSREGVVADSVVADWRKEEALVPPAYKHMVGYSGVDRAFEIVARGAKGRAIPVMLLGITIPTQPMIDSDKSFPPDIITDPKIDELARKYEFRCFDTLGPLANTLRQVKGKIQDLVLSPSDWHFNTIGNRQVGNALIEPIQRALPRAAATR